MRKKINEAVVTAEAWASALEKLWQYRYEILAVIAWVAAMTGLGSWFASEWHALASQGWGVYPFAGVAFAFSVTAAIALGVWVRRNWPEKISPSVEVKPAKSEEVIEEASGKLRTARSRMPIAHLAFDARLGKVAPTLLLKCFAFNSSLTRIRSVESEGRVGTRTETFAGKLEVLNQPTSAQSDSFFEFTLAIHLSRDEAEYLEKFLASGFPVIEMGSAKITALDQGGTLHEMPLPPRLKLNAQHQPEPAFVQQIVSPLSQFYNE